MRVALISLREKKSLDSSDNAAQALARVDGRDRRECLDTEQTLGLAKAMRDSDSFAPFVICGKNTELERAAINLELPHLALGAFFPLDLFRLWRWQRQFRFIVLLTIGQGGLTLGKRILGMRKKGTAQLNAAFFLNAPEKEFCKKGILRHVAHYLCGSQFVESRLREMWAGLFQDSGDPDCVICPPGMSLAEYDFRPPEYAADSGSAPHFVFGMAESMLPLSGAMLVVRAMSALWQKENLPCWEVRMFGSGPRYDEILEEAEKLGVSSRLSILADQPLSEVSRYCHVWLAPGVSPEEMPQTLWAGLAAGLPIICASSQLHRERLPGGAALRVTESNPQDMAKAMIGMMRDSRLRQRFAHASQAARADASLETMAKRICASLKSWMP